MKEKFELTIDKRIFKFEVDDDGLVWLVDDDNAKSNYGQTSRATSPEDARRIAKLMPKNVRKGKTMTITLDRAEWP